jgi:hypothetical protein
MVVNVPKLHTLSEPRFRDLLTEGSAHVLFHYNGYLTEPGALMRERATSLSSALRCSYN